MAAAITGTHNLRRRIRFLAGLSHQDSAGLHDHTRYAICPPVDTMRAQWATLLAVFAVAIDVTDAPANQLPSHAKPEGFRMAPLPPGEGGSLLITAPASLCADDANEFHLHYLENGGTRVVLELTAGPSACEWTVANLPEGMYETWIQRAPNGRILARGIGEVATGTTGRASMERPDMQIEGRLTRNGLPPQDLVLHFFTQGEGAGYPFRVEAPFSTQGWYQVTVDQHGQFCAEVSAPKPANSLRKCENTQPGLQQRLDIDVAPGILQIMVPAVERADSLTWDMIHIRPASKEIPPRDTLVAQQQSTLSFRLRDGYRADYIGLPYGEYDVYLTIGDDPTFRSLRRVSVTPEQETASIELSIPAFDK
jgi:hypothetical protein